MILDTLQNADRYAAVHPGFAAAFKLLRRADLASLKVGHHTIDGERLLVIIGQDEGRGHSGAKLEAHRRYIDIQCTIAGDEEMGWLPIGECREPADHFNEDRDIVRFNDSPLSWFAVPPGKFVVFFPDDAHAPLAGAGTLHKAVVKVAVDW